MSKKVKLDIVYPDKMTVALAELKNGNGRYAYIDIAGTEKESIRLILDLNQLANLGQAIEEVCYEEVKLQADANQGYIITDN